MWLPSHPWKWLQAMAVGWTIILAWAEAIGLFQEERDVSTVDMVMVNGGRLPDDDFSARTEYARYEYHQTMTAVAGMIFWHSDQASQAVKKNGHRDRG